MLRMNRLVVRFGIFVAVSALCTFAVAQDRGAVVRPDVKAKSLPRYVVDDKGDTVGSLLNPTTAVRLIGDEWIAMLVGPTGLIGSSSDVLLYPSSDCSGQAYILDPLGTGFHGFFGYGVASAGTLYYGLASEAVNMPAGSMRDVAATGLSECFAWTEANSRMPRAPVHTLPLNLTAPFHLSN